MIADQNRLADRREENRIMVETGMDRLQARRNVECRALALAADNARRRAVMRGLA